MHVILLLVNFSSGQKTFVSRAVHNIHRRAVRQTHNLASDLRTAFTGFLIPRESGDIQHVVYCKRGEQSPFVNGGSGNISAPKSATTTQSGSKPTASATSPWKLADSYVCP